MLWFVGIISWFFSNSLTYSRKLLAYIGFIPKYKHQRDCLSRLILAVWLTYLLSLRSVMDFLNNIGSPDSLAIFSLNASFVFASKFFEHSIFFLKDWCLAPLGRCLYICIFCLPTRSWRLTWQSSRESTLSFFTSIIKDYFNFIFYNFKLEFYTL